MIADRRQKKFVDARDRLRTDGLETVFETYEPNHDNESNTQFTIKAPANSHLSTEIVLERTFTVDLVAHLPPHDSQVPASAQHLKLEAEINSPGFALMNNCEQVSFNFNSTTVKSRPSDWLPWYSEMYRDSLRNCVRNSGRAFADRRVRGPKQAYDSIEDRLIINTPFRFHGGLNVQGSNHPYYDNAENFFAWDAPALKVALDADGTFNTAQGGYYENYYWSSGMLTYVDWTQFLDQYDGPHQQQDRDHRVQIETNFQLLVDGGYNADGIPTVAQIAQWQAAIAHGLQYSQLPGWTPAEQLAYEEAVEENNNWVRHGAHWDVLRNAMLHGYNHNNWHLYPESWIAARKLFYGGGAIFGNNPNQWSVPHGGVWNTGQNIVVTTIHNDNTFTARDRWAYTTLQMVHGDRPFTHAPTFVAPPASNHLLQRWLENHAQIQNSDTEDTSFVLEDFNRNDNSLLKRRFLTAMNYGEKIMTLHTILNQLCKLTQPDDDFQKDLSTLHARKALDIPGQNAPKAWRDLAERYKGMAFAIAEIQNGAHTEYEEEVHVDGSTIRWIPMERVPNSQARIRFVEPLSVGFCKPSAHVDVGCWAKSGEIIPRCERMDIHFKWCDNMNARLFNMFRMRNYFDEHDQCYKDFSLHIVDAETRLHCTHYRGVVPTPVKLGLPDIESFHIGNVSFPINHAVDLERTISFDFQYRANPEPKFVCFFGRRLFDTVPNQNKRTYNQGPAIKRISIGINTQINALRLDTANQRCRFSTLTAECFPEYKPPIDERNTFFAFPYCKLNHGSFEARSGSRMFGQITFEHMPWDSEHRYMYDDNFEIMVMFIYDGKYLEIGKHVYRSGIEML